MVSVPEYGVTALPALAETIEACSVRFCDWAAAPPPNAAQQISNVENINAAPKR
jgi:hypothetical protein